ncbi:MAG: hypothetical protein HN731_12990 [Rhodospirillaceae bacterium]|jgi:hypothetical protein|nr:hypothetical protein [Rhodospirillaceae bacterium]
MKWLLFVVLVFSSSPLFAQERPLPEDEMKTCRISAANIAVKINPAYHIEFVDVPKFDKDFEEKDEFGKKLFVARYLGKIAFSIGNIKGQQKYSCTFISYDNLKWDYNWSGMGSTT